MALEIVEQMPSAEEYNCLRQLASWDVYELEVIVRALPNSLYCVCAMSDGNIVGRARVIGDGGLVYYIKMSSSIQNISGKASACK